MIFLWLYLCYGCLAFNDIGIPRVRVEEEEFEVDVKSTAVWNMNSLFGKKSASQISSYQLEGLSSCIVQNPHLGLKELYTYEESTEILDFSIVNNVIYYLTMSGIKMLSISAPIKSFSSYDLAQEAKKIEGIKITMFNYLNVIKLEDNNLLMLLKNWNATFSYITVDYDKPISDMFETEPYFVNFAGSMQMKSYENFVIIPAGKNGLMVYEYNNETKKLDYKGKIDTSGDIRDFAFIYSVARNSLVALIADHEQGLIVMDVNKASLGKGEIEAKEIVKKEELINIKSLITFSEDNKDKLLIILDALGGSSKYAILSLKLDLNITITYTQMKLIDGVANFGDYDKGYVAIIMPNSIMINKVTNEGELMTAYLSQNGVNNAKIIKIPNHVGPHLVHSYKSKLMATKLVEHDGFLVCRTGEEGIERFTILGQAKNCRVGMKITGNCYYEKPITLQIIDTGNLDTLWIFLIIFGITTLVLVIGLFAVLIITCRKCSNTYQELKSKRENFNSTIEEKKES